MSVARSRSAYKRKYDFFDTASTTILLKMEALLSLRDGLGSSWP